MSACCNKRVMERKTREGISVLFSHNSAILQFVAFSISLSGLNPFVRILPFFDAISGGTFFLIAWTECSAAAYRNIAIEMWFLHTDPFLCKVHSLTGFGGLVRLCAHVSTCMYAHVCSPWGFPFFTKFIDSLYNRISALPLLPVPAHVSPPPYP